MTGAGERIIYFVLMVLGFIHSQTLVTSDPGIQTGNGEFTAFETARYIPEVPDVFLMLDFSPETLKDPWIKKFGSIPEINRAIEAYTRGDSKKNREFKVLVSIIKQILKLRISQASVSMYIDGDIPSLRIIAAFQCEEMKTATFFLETMGIFLEGDRKVTSSHINEWTLFKTRRRIDNLHTVMALSDNMILFEWAVNRNLELIEKITKNNFNPAIEKASFIRTSVKARGDSSDILFLALNARSLADSFQKFTTRPGLQALQTVFKLGDMGNIVYSIRSQDKGFKENFSVLNSSKNGFLVKLINHSSPLNKEILRLVPEDALYVGAGGYRIYNALETFLDCLRNNDNTAEMADTIEAVFKMLADNGIDIQNNIIGSLGNTGLFFMCPPQGILPIPGLAIAIECRSPESIFEIFELIQNERFQVTRRKIHGVETYTAWIHNIPMPLTGGTCTLSKDYLIIASAPDMFERIIKASKNEKNMKFLSEKAFHIPETTLFFQYGDTEKAGTFLYSLMQNFLPIISKKIKPLQHINRELLPLPEELFKDAPLYTVLVTKKKGMEISSPLPFGRIISSIPALLPVFAHILSVKSGKPAKQMKENQKKQVKEKEEDIF